MVLLGLFITIMDLGVAIVKIQEVASYSNLKELQGSAVQQDKSVIQTPK